MAESGMAESGMAESGMAVRRYGGNPKPHHPVFWVARGGLPPYRPTAFRLSEPFGGPGRQSYIPHISETLFI